MPTPPRWTLLLALIALASQVAPAPARDEDPGVRRVAVTIDDLPFVGGPDDLESVRNATSRLLGALSEYDVPATAFVTGSRVHAGDRPDQRMDLLRQWRDRGIPLENHGYDHLSLNRTPCAEYLDDLDRGEEIPRMLMSEVGKRVAFFRAPMNHTGRTGECRDSLLEHLEARGQRLAPFTVEHADYAFNKVHVEAVQARNRDEAKRLGKAYLEHLGKAFSFAEELSRDTFGREIPQVFLIHANALNARYLREMLGALRERGYSFISLEEAMTDPAYSRTDEYLGGAGISWLHRWRVGMGLPDRLRDEPDPPRWVLEAYRKD